MRNYPKFTVASNGVNIAERLGERCVIGKMKTQKFEERKKDG